MPEAIAEDPHPCLTLGRTLALERTGHPRARLPGRSPRAFGVLLQRKEAPASGQTGSLIAVMQKENRP
jgi:hypothetical protein